MLSSSRILRIVCLVCLAALVAMPGAARAEESAAFDGTVTLPEPTDDYDITWRLTDDNPNSRITLEKGRTLAISWTGAPAALLLEWFLPPVGAQVDLCDRAGTVLETLSIADGLYSSLIPLPDGAQSAVLTAPAVQPAPTPVPVGATRLKIKFRRETTLDLSEYRLLTADEADVYASPVIAGKTDLMIVAAHAGDEFCYFGSVLPAYAAEQCMQTVTVFLSHQNRLAQREAMAAQQLCGVTNQPVFLGMYYRFLEQEYADSAKAFWPEEDILPGLVEAVRKYRPEVIVTHSKAGELSDGLHAWTAVLTERAVSLAADEQQYPDSAALYGAWQVKKLYQHDGAGKTAIDTDAPLNAFSGRTAAEVIPEVFESYTQFSLYHPEANTAPRFTLVQSQAGPDTACDSLFENLAAASLTNVDAVLPTPSPTPEPTPTPMPTAVPTPAAIAAMGGADDLSWRQRAAVTLGLGLVVSAVLGAVFLRLRKKHTGGRKGKLRYGWLLVLLCLLPLFICLVLAALQTPFASGWLAAMRTDAQPTPTAASSKIAAPTSAPEITDDTDDVDGAEEPAASPFPGDDYFLAADDPDKETVFSDAEAGHWEYRSSTLSVVIDRHESEKPLLVWYVAHIRMREIDAFRPGYGYYDERGSAKEAPWLFARRYRAVLAITGDNLTNDEQHKKGIMIRKGRIYGESLAQDTMAFTTGMGMKIYTRGAFFAQDLIEDGIENTFAFGPTLVNNGEIGRKFSLHRVKGVNPRAGVGMVEPGHFVAIVVDGRQRDYSVGVGLTDFAQMFLEEGCTVAYNMDGGISAGMVFMGENLNQHRSARFKRTSSQRPWPDALLWGYSDLVPLMTDPVHNTGNKDETEALNATPTPEPTAEPSATPEPTSEPRSTPEPTPEE